MTTTTLPTSTSTLPAARGVLTEWVLARLARPPHEVGRTPAPWVEEAPLDDDGHAALYLLYELHYRGLAGVDDAWEWEPSLLGARARLEQRFLAELYDEVGAPAHVDDPLAALRALATTGDGPSLSTHVLERGTIEQLREFQVHRSAYQLKEADPHTWGLPRLGGRPKAAMVEIQTDEYGGGDEAAMHATLFADTMVALGLDPAYGRYLDHIPGVTLATCNLASLFGLHRRWRGSLVGHLALFEMTSVIPMGRYARACDRLGLPASARRFYDVHVEADQHHEQVATDDLVGGLLADDPQLADDVVFGARALTAVEARFTRHLLDAWQTGRSSLRVPLAPAGPETAAA